MRRSAPLAGFITLAALLAAPACASAAESGTEGRLREALRAAQTQLQQLQDERSRGQVREAKLQAELDELRKSAPAKPVRCTDTRASELARQLAEAATARSSLETTLAQCQDAARATEVKGADAARQAGDEAAAAKGRLAECQATNARMYQVAKEVLVKFSRHPGGDPILGLNRVARENAAQDYEDKLVDQKVKP